MPLCAVQRATLSDYVYYMCAFRLANFHSRLRTVVGCLGVAEPFGSTTMSRLLCLLRVCLSLSFTILNLQN